MGKFEELLESLNVDSDKFFALEKARKDGFGNWQIQVALLYDIREAIKTNNLALKELVEKWSCK